MPNTAPSVYALGGPSVIVQVGILSAAKRIIPVLYDGQRAHWIVCQTDVSITFGSWARTGMTDDEMDDVNQGIGLNRKYGDTVLAVPRGHTHIHFFSGSTISIRGFMVTPLSERPRR